METVFAKALIEALFSPTTKTDYNGQIQFLMGPGQQVLSNILSNSEVQAYVTKLVLAQLDNSDVKARLIESIQESLVQFTKVRTTEALANLIRNHGDDARDMRYLISNQIETVGKAIVEADPRIKETVEKLVGAVDFDLTVTIRTEIKQ